MRLKTDTLELRGIKNVTSQKTGNVYYYVYCEEADGKPCEFFATDADTFPKGLKKGDIIRVICEWHPRFKSIECVGIELVNKAG